MPYRFLDAIATADIAFSAWGESLEEMFAAAADATMNVMVDNLDGIARVQTRQIELESEAVDLLLFNLLQELIYYKDAEMLLLRVENVNIQQRDGGYFVTATAYGEELNPDRHHLIVDVKAVTLHKFRVERSDLGWETLVILDI